MARLSEFTFAACAGVACAQCVLLVLNVFQLPFPFITTHHWPRVFGALGSWPGNEASTPKSPTSSHFLSTPYTSGHHFPLLISAATLEDRQWQLTRCGHAIICPLVQWWADVRRFYPQVSSCSAYHSVAMINTNLSEYKHGQNLKWRSTKNVY